MDELPWRGLYDRVFSHPILAWLLTLCAIVWLATPKKPVDFVKGFGLALPGLYVFTVSVLFERGENNRFKFFIEPVMFMFLVSQLYFGGSKLCGWWKTRLTGKPAG